MLERKEPSNISGMGGTNPQPSDLPKTKETVSPAVGISIGGLIVLVVAVLGLIAAILAKTCEEDFSACEQTCRTDFFLSTETNLLGDCLGFCGRIQMQCIAASNNTLALALQLGDLPIAQSDENMVDAERVASPPPLDILLNVASRSSKLRVLLTLAWVLVSASFGTFGAVVFRPFGSPVLPWLIVPVGSAAVLGVLYVVANWPRTLAAGLGLQGLLVFFATVALLSREKPSPSKV